MGTSRRTASAAALTLGLVACGGTPPPLEEPRHPTGSTTLAASADFTHLYVANTDEDTVARITLDGDKVEQPLPGRPTRLARAGDRVFVTLRGRRALATLTDTGVGLELDDLVTLGHEPYGVVASEDGARVYVASAMSGRVDELDAGTLEVLRSWSVADEPRWLALHPGGTLYVASAWRGRLTYIDLDSGDAHEASLPERSTFDFEGGGELPLARRITGDPAVSPDGRYLVVPSIYLDNRNPIATPDDPNGPIVDRGGGGYSADRFNPVVAIVPLSGKGKPHMGDAELVLTNTFVGATPVVGYVSAVAVDPTSKVILATVEGAGAVVGLPLEVDAPEGGVFDGLFDDGPRFDNFEFRNAHVLHTSAGPRGLAFVEDDRAFVHGFLDRTVERFDAGTVRDAVASFDEDRAFAPGAFESRAGQSLATSDRTLPIAIEQGRRLFFSTRDSRMSLEGSGVSCALCHAEGRTDGITWHFTTGARQTPSLAGQVSLTEPVRWEGDRATVEDDARSTSQGLMGGSGIADEDLGAIAAFIDWTPDVDSPRSRVDDPAVARGRAIFERPDVACASCHNGERFTDNRSYAMFGMREVQTRSLVGVAGSPPYLHDGFAATLRDLLVRVRSGEMGDTSSLSDAELDDLEAYLLSL